MSDRIPYEQMRDWAVKPGAVARSSVSAFVVEDGAMQVWVPLSKDIAASRALAEVVAMAMNNLSILPPLMRETAEELGRLRRENIELRRRLEGRI